MLLVDDDAPTGKAIGRVLEREGLGYTFVDSAEEGIKVLENVEFPFSLILSDQRMPGMPGTEFLSRAKELAPDTIRYLITGYSEMDTIINAVNKGAVQHYISKPWTGRNCAGLSGTALPFLKSIWTASNSSPWQKNRIQSFMS